MYITVVPITEQHGEDTDHDFMFECDTREKERCVLSPILAAGDFDFNIWDIDVDEPDDKEYPCMILRFWDKFGYTSALVRNVAVYVMNSEGKTIDRFLA